ncbi:MAG: phosphoglucomutase/phosphomannomutase family protein [Candidatus Sumerlaeaceae bacterium]|nr:phosphoglucomutase/phosphomannomutase family protein [Candidatus Sumerlaeaceae bacterium]
MRKNAVTPVAAEPPVLPRFGTDGWRAIIAEQFTFENVRKIAAAASRYLRDAGERVRPIVVGYDTRFLSAEFARAFAETAARCGATVYLSKAITPTPMLSFAVRHYRAALGVMITASHNPYYYNGIKFKAAYGGPALPELTQTIEEYLHALSSSAYAHELGGKLIEKDLAPPYWRQIEGFVHTPTIRKFQGTVVYDAMHGAGIGTVNEFLKRLRIPVIAVRNDIHPLFGGGGPEPIAQNLEPLHQTLRKSKATIGLATDGDADRFGVLDEKGQFVQLHDLMPLLFEYLVESRGWSGDVVRTTSMHNTIDRLAAALGRNVMEVPVGFKNVCEKMLSHDILIGGEESGGFGYKNHLPERDGILSCLLLVEMLAHRSTSISQLVRQLRRRTGPFAYGRIDKHFSVGELRKNFLALRETPPTKFAGIPVERVSTADGIKFYFADGSWMLMRISDTEPLGRIYVGSHDDATVQKLLRAGEAKLFRKGD